MNTHRRVLFICTGNYYRSRFAEAVFNHHAEQQTLDWRALSRGLKTHLAEGDLSPYTADALRFREIELRHTGPTRVSCCEDDLCGADLIIALDEQEHRPMVVDRFPHWEERFRFWGVADAPWTAPADALPAIERLVLELLEELKEPEKA